MEKIIRESLLERFEDHIKFQGELYELHINPAPHEVLPNSRFVTDKEGNLYSLFSPSSLYQNLIHGQIVIILRAKGYPVKDPYSIGDHTTLALQRYEKTNKIYISKTYDSAEDVDDELFNRCKEKIKHNWILTKKKIQYGDDIKESISFERGKDPKEVLGIGVIGNIKHCIKEFGKLELNDKNIADYTLDDVCFSVWFDNDGRHTIKNKMLKIYFSNLIEKSGLSKYLEPDFDYQLYQGDQAEMTWDVLLEYQKYFEEIYNEDS